MIINIPFCREQSMFTHRRPCTNLRILKQLETRFKPFNLNLTVITANQFGRRCFTHPNDFMTFHGDWIRELKQLRRRPQRRLQKNNRFNDQNNSSALASCFLVHFFDVHCTITTWNLLICRFIEDVDMRRRFFFLFLNQNKILKNSTPGKVACIWHNERVQIDAIKFERTQIHFFFTDVFTAVVVVLA